MNLNSFNELNLIEPLIRALGAENYTTPTPIQTQAIPYLLDGRDLLGCAQTGTGKTAAFALPMLQRLSAERAPSTTSGRPVRALVLAPTRELAAQINESLRTYGRHLNLTSCTIYGGVGQREQVRQLQRGVDIIVATPGRLLDHMNQGNVRLGQLQILVLDEADRMLDMGFIRDIRRILATVPAKRQTMLFSATMPADILRLAQSVLTDPIKVSVTPVATTADRIDQKVMFVDRANKPALLGELLKDRAITRALVFTRTKHGANRLAAKLASLRIAVEAIHGNKTQSARERAIDGLRNGRTRVLVATDVASRGIDVDGISHVINFDLPNLPESYVHRIGRTARAGASGIALSFCDREETGFLRDIEKLIKQRLSVIDDHPFSTRRGARLPAAA